MLHVSAAGIPHRDTAQHMDTIHGESYTVDFCMPFSSVQKFIKPCTCHCIACLRHMRGHTVAQLVEALCYKPEGSGFDSRCRHWKFLVT